MEANRRIHIFIKRKLPLHLRRTRNIFFVSFSTCALVGLLGIAVWLYWMGSHLSALSCLIAAALVCLSMVIWRWGGGVAWGSAVYQTSLMGLILFNAAITGGVTSPVMTWFAIIPLLPLFTASRTWALTSMATSFICVLGLYVAQSHGWLHHGAAGFILQSTDAMAAPPEQATWQSMSFAAGMFSLMFFAQMVLVQTYDTAKAHHLRRLKQTNQRLATLSTNLRAANAHKDQFLAMVSHEMRTPLNAVTGYLELLAEDARLPTEVSDYVQGARNSASHLLTVINDLLDYSQIQQGKLVLSPQAVKLRDMLTTTHQTLAHRAQLQNLAYPLVLDDDIPQWGLVDPHRLTQIIINLLGNALKFTPRGEVRMRMSYQTDADNPKHGTLCISVQDTGLGIPAESLEEIFQPFIQLKASEQQQKSGNALRGNGLGLAITRSLVRSHNGTLEVESTVGQGSTFWVKLPIEVVAPPVATPINHPIKHDAQIQLLIVDDHITNRLVASAAILRSIPNAIIEQACNGTEALEKMRAHRYDVILMDLIMPGLSGTDVVQRVRDDSSHPYPDVPIIALTANVAEEAVKECFALKFKDVLPKPFNRDVLVQTILTYALPQRTSD